MSVILHSYRFFQRVAGVSPSKWFSFRGPEGRGTRGRDARDTVGRGVAVIAISALFLAGGCRPDKAADPSQRRPVQRRATKGPVRMTVQTDRDEVRIAEKMKLTIDVHAENGVHVTLPKIGDTVGGFRVVRCTDAPSVPEGEGRLWRRSLELESHKSGTLKIPAQVLVFEDRRDPAKPIHSEIKTEPVDVRVVSVLEGRADPRTFRDIKGVIELTPETSYTWAYVAAGSLGGAAILAGAVVLVRRKRSRAVTAEGWALRQLDKLAKSRLTQPGRQRHFYYRLSDIVRLYIQRRFDLPASHETTDEFLLDVQKQPVLAEEHKGFLRAFLEAADLAKYACYQPDSTETHAALDAARTFVVSSALRAEEKEKDEKTARRFRRGKNKAVAV
jgi:hypothetical protein